MFWYFEGFYFYSCNLKFCFQEFEGIECEWPLIYIFMIIDGVFKSQPEQVEEYQNLLKSKIKRDVNGGTVSYFVLWVTFCIKNI